MINAVGANIRCDGCQAVQRARQCVAIDEARRGVSEGWVGIAVDAVRCIDHHGERASIHIHCAINIGQCIVGGGRQCSLGCGIGPDVRCAIGKRIKGTSQGVTIDETCATHCEGQRWVGIAIESSERITGDGDWTNQDIEVRACVADRIVCVVERSLVDRESTDIGCRIGRRIQSTRQRITIDQTCSRVG